MEHFTKDLNQADITLKLKHIFCHDPGCWVCAQGKGHGPYWHASYEEQGQTIDSNSIPNRLPRKLVLFWRKF